MTKSRTIFLSAFLIASCMLSLLEFRSFKAQLKVQIANDGKAFFTIVLPPNPTATQTFAASELEKYLEQISQAAFSISSSDQDIEERAIVIENSNDKEKERYSISVHDQNIKLTGSTDRATLYAVYDFLHRLVCQWIAPKFSFYNGQAEHIPIKSTLVYEATQVVSEQPVFKYRTLDVDQGQSHNAENLKKIIDWMPKLRYNALRVPMNYRGGEKVKWENWSDELKPEIEKRGLIIEVGGHGYQNFLNADMEEGTLFKKNPEWFAKDSNCRPSPSERLVINTENPEAVEYFINNVINYLQQHPEIDVFDLWPPDVGRWAACPEWKKFGEPADRQAKLTNKVLSEIKKVRPDLRLKILAYARALAPPTEVNLDEEILVDFCPINQNFEKQICDLSSKNNSDYLETIHSWRTTFKGDIGLYSYYRKYAWRSLPNVIPHYIQRDMQCYAEIPLQGISIYSEPADWATYELNHYMLGKVAWDSQANVDSLINNFVQARYEKFWKSAKEAYALLESTTRTYGSIPFTTLKSEEKIEQRLQKIDEQLSALDKQATTSADVIVTANIDRLIKMLEFAYKDLQIQKYRVSDNDSEVIKRKVKKLVYFLEANENKGLFLLSGKNNLSRFMRHYNARD